MEFEIIVAVNHLRDDIKVLTSKVEDLTKSPYQQLNRKYLDDRDVCRILHVSDRTLYKMRHEGQLPFILIGRRILYEASDVYALMENRKREREERFREKAIDYRL